MDAMIEIWTTLASRTFFCFQAKAEELSVFASAFVKFLALLRNCTSSSRVKLFRFAVLTFRVLSSTPSLAVNRSVNSGRISAASPKPESISAFCTLSCSNFFLRLRCTSYAVISDASSKCRVSSSAVPPWRPCLNTEFIFRL